MFEYRLYIQDEADGLVIDVVRDQFGSWLWMWGFLIVFFLITIASVVQNRDALGSAPVWEWAVAVAVLGGYVTIGVVAVWMTPRWRIVTLDYGAREVRVYRGNGKDLNPRVVRAMRGDGRPYPVEPIPEPTKHCHGFRIETEEGGVLFGRGMYGSDATILLHAVDAYLAARLGRAPEFLGMEERAG